jgi:hypothetical protein
VSSCGAALGPGDGGVDEDRASPRDAAGADAGLPAAIAERRAGRPDAAIEPQTAE